MTETTRGRGDRYALTALRKRRAILASEIVQLEAKLRATKDSLVHVDATLRLLDPDSNPEKIPNKRQVKRIRLFRQGELSRLILDAIRTRGGSATVPEIVGHLLAAGGHGAGARPAVAGRVRGNLAYAERRGKVRKEGSGRSATWRLPEAT
jgi:hypothetical protein